MTGTSRGKPSIAVFGAVRSWIQRKPVVNGSVVVAGMSGAIGLALAAAQAFGGGAPTSASAPGRASAPSPHLSAAPTPSPSATEGPQDPIVRSVTLRGPGLPVFRPGHVELAAGSSLRIVNRSARSCPVTVVRAGFFAPPDDYPPSRGYGTSPLPPGGSYVIDFPSYPALSVPTLGVPARRVTMAPPVVVEGVVCGSDFSGSRALGDAPGLLVVDIRTY
ncbi:hypothetical protein AB0B89_08595 [Sphaerisporangium sp. NPDC049002]|uniref:hypothetical protein n=1 Tax=unclassified Sphaerisporangium TaxID=2630420 RepID=UPI0034059586